MVFVHDIRIENYYSIGDIEYKVQEGIFKLSGSNGQGKTSLCSALSQCLYNKSIKNTGTLIDDTYNKITKRPYRISTTLSVNDKKYCIVNDREENNISIFLEGINISPKGIKNQLALIQNIIGIDYETFISLTYLSQSSMNSVFDLADTNNILHKFFDVSLISFLEKNLKVERRELNKQINFLNQQKEDLARTIESLSKYQVIDVKPLIDEKNAKSRMIAELSTSDYKSDLSVIRHSLDKMKEELNNIKEPMISHTATLNILGEQLSQLKTGSCPLCGSNTTNSVSRIEDSIEEHKQSILNYRKQLEDKKNDIQKLEDKKDKLEQDYTIKLDRLSKELSSIETRILVAEEKNKGFEDIRKESKSFEEKLSNISKTIEDLQDKFSFVDASLSVITSGAITKQYVKAFLSTFNQRMMNICEQSDIEFSIKVVEDSGKINYVISNTSGNEITFENLSSGERTRVSLIILLGIVDTLEILTNVNINILMLDELLSVLDKEGIDLFMDLLNSYRSKKHLWIIQHHEEIPDSYFDGIVRVRKDNGLTKIFIENK